MITAAARSLLSAEQPGGRGRPGFAAVNFFRTEADAFCDDLDPLTPEVLEDAARLLLPAPPETGGGPRWIC